MTNTSKHRIGSADLSDAANDDIHMDAGIRPIWEGAYLSGIAQTVEIPTGDHRSVFDAIDKAEDGTVLVINAHGDTSRCVFGEVTSVAARERGIVGVVIDGAVRDVDAIRQLEFPVFARGTVPRGPRPRLDGDIGHPILVGGRTVHPGDLIVGDGDGVVVVPLAHIAQYTAGAQGVIEQERDILRGLHDGRSVLEFTSRLRLLNEGHLS